MDAKTNKVKPKHDVIMQSCAVVHMSGVEKVVGSSDKSLVLLTSEGPLSVSGSGLKIVAFSTTDAVLDFTGKVTRLDYGGKKSFLKRLFS